MELLHYSDGKRHLYRFKHFIRSKFSYSGRKYPIFRGYDSTNEYAFGKVMELLRNSNGKDTYTGAFDVTGPAQITTIGNTIFFQVMI